MLDHTSGRTYPRHRKSSLRVCSTILSVSPLESDHLHLRDVFRRGDFSIVPTPSWTLHQEATLAGALCALSRGSVPVVLCEQDLKPGSWHTILDQASRMHAPPFVIVTSRLADERLWAEALNLGAYDVLAKPFDEDEVVRVVGSAWRRWTVQYSTRSMAAGTVFLPAS